MSPVTASVLIGPNHPNEANILATHFALLREHHRASWHIQDLSGGPEHIMAIGHPDEILDCLFLAIARWIVRPACRGTMPAVTIKEPPLPRREYEGLALVVATYRTSGLEPHLRDLRELTETAVTVAERSWQRHWSMWEGSWQVDDGSTLETLTKPRGIRPPLP